MNMQVVLHSDREAAGIMEVSTGSRLN